jgi:phenylacetate-CoA ligase
MPSLTQRLYWRAPYFVKCAMASWQARRLDRTRHGREYAQILADIRLRDGWSGQQFREYQDRELASLVAHAAAHVPHYRRAFAQAGVDAERFGGLDDLPRLPVLHKDIVRAGPLALVDERLDPRTLITHDTSGTTGTPVALFRDVWLDSCAFAYIDARCRSACTHAHQPMLRRVNPSITVGGKLVAAPHRRRPPFWVYNARWRQLYMSSYHLSAANLDAYLAEIRRGRWDYIDGYSSSLYTLARHAELSASPAPFKAAFVTADALLPHMRPVIERAFGCRVYNQYGAGEMCVLAVECERGSMHVSPDYGIVEVLDDADAPVPAGQSGNLVCTSLVNRVQPFIRYRLGDRGSLSAGPCPCGWPTPVLASLEGREDDVLLTADGRRIGRLDQVYWGASGVLEAQIVQESPARVRVLVVAGEGFGPASEQAIAGNIRARMGDVEVSVERVETIPRTAGGKFRAVVRGEGM